jgi:hypothetical protein
LTARDLGRGTKTQREYESSLRRALRQFVASLEQKGETVAEIVGIVQVNGPSDKENDEPVLRRVLEDLPCDIRFDRPGADGVDVLRRATESYSSLDFLVATRVHSAILAACKARPFIVVEYIGGKAKGVVDFLQLPPWICLTAHEEVSDSLRRAWEARQDLETQIWLNVQRARQMLESLRL